MNKLINLWNSNDPAAVAATIEHLSNDGKIVLSSGAMLTMEDGRLGITEHETGKTVYFDNAVTTLEFLSNYVSFERVITNRKVEESHDSCITPVGDNYTKMMYRWIAVTPDGIAWHPLLVRNILISSNEGESPNEWTLSLTVDFNNGGTKTINIERWQIIGLIPTPTGDTMQLIDMDCRRVLRSRAIDAIVGKLENHDVETIVQIEKLL